MDHTRARQRSFRRTWWALLHITYHVFAPWRSSWRKRWGARPNEPDPTMAGEDLIGDAAWEFTRAVSIAAPAEEVWPWIVQMGQGRGGFYSFERLENLIGCHITNTDLVLPEHQTLTVGDPIRLHPTAPPLHVALLEPGRSLVLTSRPEDDAPGAASTHTVDTLWAFHVIPEGPDACRLIERGKNGFGASTAERLFFSPLLLEPVGFVMSREMLLAVKERAETSRAGDRSHSG